jgi:hypothetical protein
MVMPGDNVAIEGKLQKPPSPWRKASALPSVKAVEPSVPVVSATVVA